MPTNTLTDTQCRTFKAQDKAKKLFDGFGLHLYVSPKGAKVWRVAYRFEGKPKTYIIGPYPLVSLADARLRRDSEVRDKLAKGIDPMAKAKTKKNVPTLLEASDAYWSGRLDITDAYRMNAQNGIAQHLGPKLGQRPVDDISRQDLLDALMEMDRAGLLVYVRSVRGWVSQVFEWAIEHEHCETNPAALINPKKAFRVPAKDSHAAVTPGEVPDLLRRLKLEDDIQSVRACHFLALTWVRTKEMRSMLWEQLEGKDGQWSTWRIPKIIMKRRVEHLVPLSRQAVKILRAQKEQCRGSKYVFPAEHTILRPMSENTVLYLLHRIGYKGEMTGHGWRSVGSTWANEAGYNPDAIERQLAHIPGDEVRAAYNRAAYLKERKQIMQDWADWLDACAKTSP
jgi:integrase